MRSLTLAQLKPRTLCRAKNFMRACRELKPLNLSSALKSVTKLSATEFFSAAEDFSATESFRVTVPEFGADSQIFSSATKIGSTESFLMSRPRLSTKKLFASRIKSSASSSSKSMPSAQSLPDALNLSTKILNSRRVVTVKPSAKSCALTNEVAD